MLFLAALALLVLLPAQKAWACCTCIDCQQFMIEPLIERNHNGPIPPAAPYGGEGLIEEAIVREFIAHRDWKTDVFLRNYIPPALINMTEQMSAVAMYQVQILGMLLDAKHQQETQLLLDKLQNEAHRDYQPSDDFCWFGTGIRSAAATETRALHNTNALSRRALLRHLGNASLSGAGNEDEDLAGRWRRFVLDNCDSQDNNWAGGVTGLVAVCGPGSPGDPERANRDIDYTRLIEEPRTINVDFTGFDPGLGLDGEEEDVLALANNLYGHKVLSRKANEGILRNRQAHQYYFLLRSIAAKRSVAENSFNSIVGLKSAGTSDLIAGAGPPLTQTREYLAAILQELGIGDENGNGTNADEIYGMIGERPSYYAQLEILSKRIFQNPDFYSSLYDTPANVARKAAALKAIELMLDRALYETETRQEMLMSVLLSSTLRDEFRTVNSNMLLLGQEQE